MILFNYRPTLEEAWDKSSFRVVMGGMGDDTAMLLAEMYHRGFEPDEIVFCDTGSEFQHTYKFIDHLTAWCEERHWSKVVVLTKTDKNGEPLSVIGTAEKNNDLPAAAFGKKSCSLRYKTETADKYFNNHEKAWAAWGVDRKGRPLSSHTGSILRIVGINADEPQRAAKWQPEEKWCQVFPLFDWDIGEKESYKVESCGLYYPNKSSCICCPHLSGGEIYMLKMQYPEDYERVRRIEANYQKHNMKENSTTIGLCRRRTMQQKLDEFLSCGIDKPEGGKCEACK